MAYGDGTTGRGGGWRASVAIAFGLAAVLAARGVSAQCSSTTAIMCGDTKNGSLDLAGETDCFQFTATAGEAVSITTKETAGLFLACWTLQGPNGSLGGACGQAERTLPDTGTYTIEVFDNAGDQTGSYDVNLVFVSGTGSNCGAAIACGDTLAGDVAAVAESDTFRFDGLVGDTVSITVQATAGGLHGCWELYNPSGASLGGACGQTEKTLAVAGTYTIRVSDDADAKTGTYDVNVEFVSDSGSSCAEAIGCGQTLARSTAAVGESDTFAFTSAAGETVSITAQETGGGTATCWDLYDPAGIGISTGCGQDEHTLAVAGRYSIRVHDDTDTKTGTYDLNLVFVSATASTCAETLACGSPLARSIGTVGESATFRFVAAAGEAVSVVSSETGGFVATCWELYDPQGISLGTSCGQSEKTLAVAGGYTIRVHDDNDSETGTYDVGLVVLSDTAHSCAVPIACGQTLTGSIDARGGAATYRVTGQPGDVVEIDTMETGGNLNACWELYDPSGASLGGACGADDRTLATNLGYTLRVYDQGDDGTGDYRVTLCNPTTTTTVIVPGTTTTTTLRRAGSDQPLTGAKLLLKGSTTKPQKRRLLLVSKDGSLALGGGAGSDDDPAQHGGLLRLRAAGGSLDSSYILEPIGWRLLKRRDPSKGWKYTKGNAIKLALVKTGRQLKVVGRGASLTHDLAARPDPLDVVFSLGARRYCFRFGGQVRFAPGKSFSATGAPAPAACPSLP